MQLRTAIRKLATRLAPIPEVAVSLGAPSVGTVTIPTAYTGSSGSIEA